MLSTWSYHFAEIGATPDKYLDPSWDYDFDEEILDMGDRRRSRITARMLFNDGGLCVAAAVPMGIVENHALAVISPPALACYVLLSVAVGYSAKTIIQLWSDLKEDAFSSWFEGKKVSQVYKQRDAIAKLFFGMNPLPLWTLFSKTWRTTLKYPSAQEILDVENRANAANDQRQRSSDSV